MSIHRFAAKRDRPEKAIRARFAHHGWHTEQVSGTGMPDLMVWPSHPGTTFRNVVLTASSLVDVKDGNGKPTPAQVKKWTALYAKGIPVYVVRTAADVDALVAGTLAPWKPAKPSGMGHAIEPLARMTKHELRKVKENYTPPHSEPNAWVPARGGPFTLPRSEPMDAAKPEHDLAVMTKRLGARHVRNVRNLGSEVLAERLKPPGEENYNAALERAMAAAKEAEVFAPPANEGAGCRNCEGIHPESCMFRSTHSQQETP